MQNKFASSTITSMSLVELAHYELIKIEGHDRPQEVINEIKEASEIHQQYIDGELGGDDKIFDAISTLDSIANKLEDLDVTAETAQDEIEKILQKVNSLPASLED